MKKLSPKLDFEDKSVKLTGYLPRGKEKPVIIVLPGGGYEVCAKNEGEPVAKAFAKLGFAAFTLHYSVLRGKRFGKNEHTLFPEPLREVALTIKHIRSNAEEYGIDSNKIALFGASAGGHLAATYANMWNSPYIYDGIETPSRIRVNGCVLLYGATDTTINTTLLSAIYGKEEFTDEEKSRFVAKDAVSEDTPPTVLFHSVNDPIVPVRESLELFAALQQRGIPTELHLFGSGGHAYGLGEKTPLDGWQKLAANFLNGVWNTPEQYDKANIADAMRKIFG